MAFTFFTLGGRQFWEDIYVYQKWRIQRNCITKHYRLLDNWDIRRAGGSFEQCSRALTRCAEIFQLTPPKTKAVVLLHELAGNKNQFNQMVKMAESAGFSAIAVNYPSTRKELRAHVRQLELLLNSLEYVKEVSFITAGIGGLLVRLLLAADSQWKKKIKTGRIVQIDPPNRGFRLWERLSDSKIAALFLGPSIKSCDSHKVVKIPRFPDTTEFGIINTHNRIADMLKDSLPDRWRIFFPQIGDSFLPGAKDMIDIKTWKTNPAADDKTILACKNFLLNGKF